MPFISQYSSTRFDFKNYENVAHLLSCYRGLTVQSCSTAVCYLVQL